VTAVNLLSYWFMAESIESPELGIRNVVCVYSETYLNLCCNTVQKLTFRDIATLQNFKDDQ
jgi:hypothetical protein